MPTAHCPLLRDPQGSCQHRGRCPHPRSPRGRGAGDGLRPKPLHPTTGTSAATVQHQGFGFAPVLTRSHSLRSLALRLPGWPLTLPLRFLDRRLFGFGMEKGSRGRGIPQGAQRLRICRESPLMPRSAPMLRAGGWGCSSPDRLPRGEQSRRAVGDDLFLAFWRCLEGSKNGRRRGRFPLLDT